MNLFAFVGNDDLQKNEALEKAVTQWLGDAAHDPMARELFFGDDLKWEEVSEAYHAVSLFCARKALILKNLDKAGAAHQKQLAGFLSHENPAAAVFASAEKWEAGSVLRKLFTAKGKVNEFKLPYPNQIPQWLSGRAKTRYGRKLATSEGALLQDLTGNDLADLDRELEKLDTFLAPNREIRAEDILELVAPHRAMDIFEFQKHMGLRERGKGLLSLRGLLDAGEPPFQIALRLFSHFLVLLKVRHLSDTGQGVPAIAEALKLNPFFHFQRLHFMDQARSRSETAWKKSLIRLARLEAEFKQGKFSHRFEIEMAFAALA